MNVDLVLLCPRCGTPALADDEYCESCGSALGDRRDGGRHHFEIDAVLVAGVSDRGLRHQRNEDALFVEANDAGAVAVVCDGVSASAAPQVAAQAAAQLVGSLLSASLGGPTMSGSVSLADSLAAAGSAVVDLPWMAAPERDGPSCTVVAARWDGSKLAIGWAGDSRAYFVTDTEVCRLTNDHSWAQSVVDAGLMSAEEAETDVRAHAITRWLGPDAPDDPAIRTFEPGSPGRLVLCSDGLWNHLVDDDELAVLVHAVADGSAIALARRLVRMAISRGGHDNVTVAVVEIVPNNPVHTAEES